MSIRTIFLIDGFNVYHSVVDLERYCGLKAKWLDYFSLCSSYLYLVGRDATLESVYYFTALAHHLNDPDIILHHQAYIRCLRETGIIYQLGRFKQRTAIKCRHCGSQIIQHVEKETDVAIASKMFEVLLNDECDCVVMVTGDTDLTPAVTTAQRLFPHKQIIFMFPYRRKNEELAQIAPGSFKINGRNYVRHQLPDPFFMSDGTKVSKPPNW